MRRWETMHFKVCTGHPNLKSSWIPKQMLLVPSKHPADKHSTWIFVCFLFFFSGKESKMPNKTLEKKDVN